MLASFVGGEKSGEATGIQLQLFMEKFNAQCTKTKAPRSNERLNRGAPF